MNNHVTPEAIRMADVAAMPVGRLLGIAGRLSSMAFSKVLESQGLSHTGWIVLSKLDQEDDLTQGDVAARCFVTPPTLTAVVDALEATGALTRSRDREDRRVVRLKITDSGRDLLHDTRSMIDDDMAPIFAGLRPADEAVVRRFLTNVIQRLTSPDTAIERTQ
ncbi:MAG: MarR family winged helix-turn-helix transcriptional regulator [Pseudonocardiales bacterium]